MFKSLPHWLRASLFSVSAAAIWALWSLPSLVGNRPTDFQASGSIIVAWAIFSYGRDRIKREKSIADAQSNALISAHNYVHAELEFNRSLAHNTSNMHTLAYLKVLRTLGMKDTEAGDTDRAIASIEKEMSNHSAHNNLHAKLEKAASMAESDRQRAKEMQNEQGAWVNVVKRIELLFVIFGTLQWGYGDRWVVALHEANPFLW